MNEHCPLGRWLKEQGASAWASYPAFEMLVQRHQYFSCPGGQRGGPEPGGRTRKTLQVFHGGYRHASNQVTLLLKELKRSLGR